jgi:phosphotransferase system HPr-like phosphotransfer protein
MKHIATFLMLIALALTASAQITLTVLTPDDKQALTAFHTGDRTTRHTAPTGE